MKYKHYAPKADLVLVEGETDKVVARINELVREKQQLGQKVGVIATDETFLRYEADHVVSIGAREDEDAIARHLYKTCASSTTGMWMRSTRRVLPHPRTVRQFRTVAEGGGASGDSGIATSGRGQTFL